MYLLTLFFVRLYALKHEITSFVCLDKRGFLVIVSDVCYNDHIGSGFTEAVMNYLEEYYNSSDEEGRLLSRHGQVFYLTTMKYIYEYISHFAAPDILEVGAGTGRRRCGSWASA